MCSSAWQRPRCRLWIWGWARQQWDLWLIPPSGFYHSQIIYNKYIYFFFFFYWPSVTNSVKQIEMRLSHDFQAMLVLLSCRMKQRQLWSSETWWQSKHLTKSKREEANIHLAYKLTVVLSVTGLHVVYHSLNESWGSKISKYFMDERGWTSNIWAEVWTVLSNSWELWK